MVSLIKITALLCACIHHAGASAVYLDSDFEINTSGYLYNIGAKRYLGLEPTKKLEIVGIEEPRKALRFRVYLNKFAGDAGFVFMLDEGLDDVVGAGKSPTAKQMHEKPAMKTCTSSASKKVILEKYTGSNHFGFFVTPPVLLHENAFNLMVGEYCIAYDSETTSIKATGCQETPLDKRNKQMFAWVDSKTYNRGVDPISYRPNPYAHIQNKPREEKKENACKASQSEEKAHDHLVNPSNLAFQKPYRPEKAEAQIPEYCK
ncbi:uncharacterized protein NEMAJ01_1974 [Nematocida major]|uniref:uncharacterized protein n=1 Tax=Nematocida major TaxID=1912982 RepID=UPI0020073D4D|nr:uncharacterized protein NEMAJ01_1974 [Nematocida major]KAH9387078.1 hypothetical protein NEMAJ01_1974 [Nematocida major]